MLIKAAWLVNPLGVDISELRVMILSQPLDSNNLSKSDAKQV